jgi:hypothetical protein
VHAEGWGIVFAGVFVLFRFGVVIAGIAAITAIMMVYKNWVCELYSLIYFRQVECKGGGG